MFTGLVETVGMLTALKLENGGARLTLDVKWPEPEPQTRLGDSVAVNGACLTVVAIELGPDGLQTLEFDLSHETLALTTFGALQPPEPCNLERAMKLGDRLGGHIVTGHVDGLGTLVQKTAHPAGWDLVFALPETLLPEVVQKGSICVDGVSLTVNHVEGSGIGVTIVPHTVAHTQLLHGLVGKKVHIETDILAKHVRRLAQFPPQDR